MNLLKKSLFLLVVITFAACSSDDDSAANCVQSDWVGTYTGTQNCDGVSEDVTVTITASGSDAILVKYETPTVETEFDPFTPNGCDLDQTGSGTGFAFTIDASLDGDDLSFKDILTIGTNTATCTITATRN